MAHEYKTGPVVEPHLVPLETPFRMPIDPETKAALERHEERLTKGEQLAQDLRGDVREIKGIMVGQSRWFKVTSWILAALISLGAYVYSGDREEIKETGEAIRAWIPAATIRNKATDSKTAENKEGIKKLEAAVDKCCK